MTTPEEAAWIAEALSRAPEVDAATVAKLSRLLTVEAGEGDA